MRTSIVKIGDAQGVILPKSFINELGKSNKVELESKNGTLLIKPAQSTQLHTSQKNNVFRDELSLTDLSNELDFDTFNS
jgi:antitoxin component of MazEF toxin-antitoxin module